MGRARKYPFDLRKSSIPGEVHPQLAEMEDLAFFQMGEKRAEVECEVCGEKWAVPICWIRKGQSVLINELARHRQDCQGGQSSA